MPELSKADVEFILELTERRFDSTSTIFCTLYKREDWVKRLRGGTYAESIVERFAHNTTWIETGDVNMRQYLSHAWWPGLDCDQPLLNGDTHALNALQRMG